VRHLIVLLINPAYGSLADFNTLLAEAHARGVRVIPNLPINHTSYEHACHPTFIGAEVQEIPGAFEQQIRGQEHLFSFILENFS
jgi:1,4-alpha-glucan branching enzyme